MNEEKECINPLEDDGSLAWLHIPPTLTTTYTKDNN